MRGQVVTFYSYKGGVGRSFAVANVAAILARWGFKVLCLDWDLEAPGLPYYFAEYAPGIERGPGILDLVDRFQKNRGPIDWKSCVADVQLPGGRVSIITSGVEETGRASRANAIDWGALYKHGFGVELELMFESARADYDFVLIDARTGISEFAGIITSQLPDILVFLFTANHQSLAGSIRVARRSDEIRNAIALDRGRLSFLPIPARFETQVEHRISNEWRERFAADLAGFYESWAPRGGAVEALLQATTIPYVPYWSFGEKLSVLEDRSVDPSGINYALETISALLVHRLGNGELLLESRDEYVSSARRSGSRRRGLRYQFFISYAGADEAIARQLQEKLQQSGFSVYADPAPGELLDVSVSRAVEAAENMIVLIGRKGKDSAPQEYEVRSFMRQASSDEAARGIIPVLLEGVTYRDVPSILRHYQTVSDLGDMQEVAFSVQRLAGYLEPDLPSLEQRRWVEIITMNQGRFVAGSTVIAVDSDGQTIAGRTNKSGRVRLDLHPSKPYQVLVAHAKYAGHIIDVGGGAGELGVDMTPHQAGSVILRGAGKIGALQGIVIMGDAPNGQVLIDTRELSLDGGRPLPALTHVGGRHHFEDRAGQKQDAHLLYSRRGVALFNLHAP